MRTTLKDMLAEVRSTYDAFKDAASEYQSALEKAEEARNDYDNERSTLLSELEDVVEELAKARDAAKTLIEEIEHESVEDLPGLNEPTDWVNTAVGKITGDRK